MLVVELEAVRKYLIKNLENFFIVPSKSLFAFSIFFIQEENSDLRFCVDYRRLNAIIRKTATLCP